MIMHRPDPAVAIRSLRSASPYIRMYKGKTFVVKAGGGVFAEESMTRALIEQLAMLHYFGVRVVLVGGWGVFVKYVGIELPWEPHLAECRRLTEAEYIIVGLLVRAQL